MIPIHCEDVWTSSKSLKPSVRKRGRKWDGRDAEAFTSGAPHWVELSKSEMSSDWVSISLTCWSGTKSLPTHSGILECRELTKDDRKSTRNSASQTTCRISVWRFMQWTTAYVSIQKHDEISQMDRNVQRTGELEIPKWWCKCTSVCKTTVLAPEDWKSHVTGGIHHYRQRRMRKDSQYHGWDSLSQPAGSGWI